MFSYIVYKLLIKGIIQDPSALALAGFGDIFCIILSNLIIFFGG